MMLRTAGALMLVVVFVGCAGIARFADNSTVHAVRGKVTTATIKVDNWGDEDRLVLIPGGPYAKNAISFSVSPGRITTAGQQVIVTDGAATLSIVDFSQKPARQTGQITLQDDITAVHVHDNGVFAALAAEGIAVVDITDPTKPRIIKQFNNIQNVSRFKSHNGNVYALADNKQLVLFATDDDSQPRGWRQAQTMTLPAAASDFAITGDHILLTGTERYIGSVSLTNTTRFIDTLPLQGESRAVRLSANVAYVADGTGGLVVVNVGNNGKLTWLGSHNKFDTVDNVYISANRAFVLDRNIRIATLNVDRKALPITGSFYKPRGPIVDFSVAGDSVYVATTHGIEQVDFPAQDHAQISNEGINQGGTRRAYIDNDIAYVADWFSGLHLYDISDPTRPRHLGNYHTPGSSKGVVVDNGYAYVGDDDRGLQIIDVRRPEHLKKVSDIQTTGLAYTLKKVGNLIYLADHRGGFHIIDVANVGHPVMKASYDTQGKSWAIDVSGNTAYVADDTSGILVFDVSDPEQPQPIGQFDPQGAAEDIVVNGNLAYASFFDKGFYILDISNPAQPAVISHIPVPGNARSVDIQGNFAYVAGWESGLNVIDITDPAAPRIVGRYDTRGSAWGADVYKGHAYVWDWWGGVRVVDISNPRRPTLAGKYHTRGMIHNLRKKGNYTYTANGRGGVQVFDIKNPLNPIWVTGFDVPGKVYDVWPSSDTRYLYAAAGEQGLQVLEVSDPFYVYDLDRYLTGGKARIVREHRNTVYVANERGGLSVFNAREPFQLELIQTLPVTVKDMWIDSDVLFAATPGRGLLAFDVQHGGKLANRHIVIDDDADRVLATADLLITATDNKGVGLWQRNDKGYKAIARVTLPESVFDMQVAGEDLLVYTRQQGLLVYDISDPADPKLYARYPATDMNQQFMIHDNGVFFGGTHTIASVQRLAKISWKKLDNTRLEITLTGKLPLGNYHLLAKDAGGNEQLWPNALQVSLPQRTKPKMSMEQFKKLYEQHRSQQQLQSDPAHQPPR